MVLNQFRVEENMGMMMRSLDDLKNNRQGGRQGRAEGRDDRFVKVDPSSLGTSTSAAMGLLSSSAHQAYKKFIN